MCLESNFRKPTEKQSTGIGWKVLKPKGSAICQGTDEKYIKNKWLNENQYRDETAACPKEGYGFHIFLKKNDALRWWIMSDHVVQRVKYRKATVIGNTRIGSDRARTIVAKEIYIQE